MPDSPASSASTYAAFWLYRLDPAWRRLNREFQRQHRAGFVEALAARDPRVTLRGIYSLAGLRHDADLLLWVHGTDLDAIQRLAVDLSHTPLGAYLTAAYTYVGVVGGGRYDPEHRPAFLRGVAPLNYVSMYPFTKTSEWYLLSYEERRAMMAEHGRLGRRYTIPREAQDAPGQATSQGQTDNGQAGNGHGAAAATTTTAVAGVATAASATGAAILTNTVDTYGLSDYEFVVAFESNDPAELCRMIEELRTVEVRRYTKADTPVFLGRLREPAEALADL
ncbi:MAG TPA: chlorite dismutase family protein [Ktedonobacterales bacterium]